MFISVDIEASGPIPGEYSMLSLGACPVFDVSKTFYREFKPISDKYVLEAIQITGFSLEKLKRAGIEPKIGMYEFRKWTRDISLGRRPIFVAFNATFDWSFVNYYFHRFLGENPYGISGLDIKAYYMGKFGKKTWGETSKGRLDPRFQSDRKHTHNALDDAIEQAEMFKKMLLPLRWMSYGEE